MVNEHVIDLALFYLILCYITLLFKETKTGWNISSKYLLYTATAAVFVFTGIFIGFLTILVYIIVSIIILVVSLPILRIFIEKRRRH
jgi:hypothetical protein